MSRPENELAHRASSWQNLLAHMDIQLALGNRPTNNAALCEGRFFKWHLVLFIYKYYTEHQFWLYDFVTWPSGIHGDGNAQNVQICTIKWMVAFISACRPFADTCCVRPLSLMRRKTSPNQSLPVKVVFTRMPIRPVINTAGVNYPVWDLSGLGGGAMCCLSNRFTQGWHWCIILDKQRKQNCQTTSQYKLCLRYHPIKTLSCIANILVISTPKTSI